MKTPLYENGTNALKNLLSTRSFVFCDLYTITTQGGGPVLRFSTGDLDVTYSGVTWTHGAPPIDQSGETGTASTAHWKAGLDVDTWSVAVMPRLAHPVTGAANPDTIAGVPWPQACAGGALDGATVAVDRAYFSAWPSGTSAFNAPAAPVGVINIFSGRVAAVDISGSTIGLSINSHLELLQDTMPRSVFQAPCRATLFDARCGLTASAYAVSGTVGAGTTQGIIKSAIAGPPGSGTYAMGRLVMTSGANSGFQRGVRAYQAGTLATLTLIAPFNFTVSVGDTFTVYPGCDKRMITCQQFGNLANFRGQPFIPAPELAL